MTQFESLSVVFSGGGTAKNCKEPCRESREPVEPQECCVWPRKFESVARNELVRCHDAAAMFHRHSPHDQIIGQNGMYWTSAYLHLLHKFSAGDMMVLHDKSPHLVNELVISAWGPTRMSVAIHWHAPIFESVVPFLNLCDAHGIVAENPLNLLNGFHLAIAKLLAKFDVIPLLESFRHFRRK